MTFSENSAAPSRRAYTGPAILSLGFRPFFFMAGLLAALSLPLALAALFGYLEIPSAFAPQEWHAHELLFGYTAAVMAGFLLTAIPNWTGRLPLQGRPRFGLVGLWLAGRAAMATSALIGMGSAPLTGAYEVSLLGLAAFAWVAAFSLFLVTCGPALVGRRGQF